MKSHLQIRGLAEAAILIALAQLLSYVRLYHFPYGGSVDLAMLPIVIFCVRWGLRRGLLTGLVFGLLQYFIGLSASISWISMLGDYALAYTAVGFAGLFYRRRQGVVWGSLSGSLARFAVHWVVGATVWGEYMPETFWNLPMTSTWLYSALYNGSYMLPDCLLLMVVSAILLRIMPRYMRGEDISRAQ